MKQRILTFLFLACAVIPVSTTALFAQVTAPEPLFAKKTSTVVDNDHVKLTMESFVSGNNVASDIAIVMDLSATMNNNVSGLVYSLEDYLTETTQNWTYGNLNNGNANGNANNQWYYLYDGEYYPVRRANNLSGGGNNNVRAMWICLNPDASDSRLYLSGNGLSDSFDTAITNNNITIFTGTLYKGWTYANNAGTSHYYKYGDEYCQVVRTTVNVNGNNTYQLSFTTENGNGTTYYLNGTGISTTPSPYNTVNNISLYFGDLYKGQSEVLGRRVEFLESAVETLLETLHRDSELDDLHHRIALVQFNSDRWLSGNTYNKPYLLESPMGGSYSKIVSDFKDILADGNLEALKNAMTVPDNCSGTSAYAYGMSLALGLFKRELGDSQGTDINGDNTIQDFEKPTLSGEDHTNYSRRPRIVVVVGDCQNNDDHHDVEIANALKADPVNAIVFVVYVNTSTSYLSNAEAWASSTDLVSTVTEYDNALIDTFERLAKDIRKALIDLGPETVVQDVIADGFEIPEGTDKVKVYTANYLSGNDKNEMTFDTPVLSETLVPTITTDGDGRQMVTVSGFDFSEEYCGSVAGVKHGQKLILEIEVQRTNAVGGPSTVTNVDATSGMKYSADGEFITYFASPTTTLPVTIQIQKEGLVKGESAVFTVQPVDADGNAISSVHVNDADVPVKPHRVILTGTAADGSAAVSATLKHLNGNCNWLVTEEGWSWDYVVNGGNASLSTATQLLNPFVFTNVKQNTTVKAAESKVTNDFGNNSVTPVKSKEP